MEILYEIIDEVARQEGCDPIDLPPLYSEVDPESLQEVIESTEAADAPIVRITYCGREVVVEGDGTVEVDGGMGLQGKTR
ncbi:HalOD1 output domain-containing protein [Natronoarchaeum mannanilyticum]|uniref:Halobacterial output domain-containing protein n=1 Tax=Natronoarchaeum mannanilyticum TaxID=926360 RepID=A0AAV3T5J9_9EURY